MALHNPPQYRYPLSEEWDRQVFKLIRELAQSKHFPVVKGDKDQRNQFLTTLISTQKSLHSWRDFLKEVIRQIKGDGAINAEELNRKYPPEGISKDKPAWVTYKVDEIVSGFIDQLATRRIEFVGEGAEIGEFILRFILGQLGQDWEQTIYMIWEMLGSEKRLSLRELNQEFKNFDYCQLF